MGCVQSSAQEEAALADEKEALHESEFITVVIEDDTEDSEEEDDEYENQDVVENNQVSGPTLVQDDGEEGARGKRKKKKKKKKKSNMVDSSSNSRETSSGNSLLGSEKKVVTAMDKLQKVIRNMHKDVVDRLQQHMHPTEEQLAVFVGQMVNVLKNLAANAPIRIKKIITRGFCSCGYDFAKGHVKKRKLFTLHCLGEALKEVLSELDNWSPAIIPSKEELADIALAASRLWDLDRNRLTRGVEYDLDIQCEKSPHDHSDQAERPLFKFVDEGVFQKPTFKSFIALLDNYTATLGVADSYTQQELAEMARFLATVMDTACMQYAYEWLARNKKVPAQQDKFVAALHSAWFDLYRRKAKNDSSGFEHVFLGERDDEKQTVSGLHNWIQLYFEEKAGQLDYKGKMRQKQRYADAEQFLTIQFEWHGQEKFISSSLIGTSPEFEMALLTMCFFNGQEDTRVTLGQHKVNIKCYPMRRRGRTYIASAFPESL